MLPTSVSTLKHQMWFWSQEDVEPAENSWQGEVRPSVLQKCGDAAKPGERTKTVIFLASSTTGQEKKQTHVCWQQMPPGALLLRSHSF